jgi:hypothetical protein
MYVVHEGGARGGKFDFFKEVVYYPSTLQRKYKEIRSPPENGFFFSLERIDCPAFI